LKKLPIAEFLHRCMPMGRCSTCANPEQTGNVRKVIIGQKHVILRILLDYEFE